MDHVNRQHPLTLPSEPDPSTEMVWDRKTP